MVKNLSAVQETEVWSLGWEDLLEKAMAPHSSIFAWRIPWTEGPDGWQSMGRQRVRHRWVTDTHTHHLPGKPGTCSFLHVVLIHRLLWWLNKVMGIKHQHCPLYSNNWFNDHNNNNFFLLMFPLYVLLEFWNIRVAGLAPNHCVRCVW